MANRTAENGQPFSDDFDPSLLLCSRCHNVQIHEDVRRASRSPRHTRAAADSKSETTPSQHSCPRTTCTVMAKGVGWTAKPARMGGQGKRETESPQQKPILPRGDGCGSDCGAPPSRAASNATVFVAGVPQASRRPEALPSSPTVFLDGVGSGPFGECVFLWRLVAKEMRSLDGRRCCQWRGGWCDDAVHEEETHCREIVKNLCRSRPSTSLSVLRCCRRCGRSCDTHSLSLICVARRERPGSLYVLVVSWRWCVWAFSSFTMGKSSVETLRERRR